MSSHFEDSFIQTIEVTTLKSRFATMNKIPKTMNLDQKLLKKLEDDSYNMIQMNKETIAKIIATFEGAIKDLDETPKDACILTCGYFRPSIYTFRLLNEYQSTKKVLLTYNKTESSSDFNRHQKTLSTIQNTINFCTL